MNVGELWAKIGLDTTDLRKGVDQASYQFDRLERKARGGLTGIDRAFQLIYKSFVVMGAAYMIRGLVQQFDDLIERVDRLNISTTKIATSIVMMQGPPKSFEELAERYQIAEQYANNLMGTLREIDAYSIASLQDLLAMSEVMVQQRILIRNTSEEQKKAFTIISNMIASYTQGQNRAQQMRQEMRGLLSGTALKDTAPVAKAIDDIIKRTSQYKNGLKDIIEISRKSKDPTKFWEMLYPYIMAAEVSLGKFQHTWESVKTSLSTAVDVVLQASVGKDFYKNVVESGLKVVDFAKKNAETIGHYVQRVMDTLGGIFSYIGSILKSWWNILDSIVNLQMTWIKAVFSLIPGFEKVETKSEGIAGLVEMICTGWEFLAKVILPFVAQKFSQVSTIIASLIDLGAAFTDILISGLKDVFSLFWKIGKAAFFFTTGQWGKMFSTFERFDPFANTKKSYDKQKPIINQALKDIKDSFKTLTSLDPLWALFDKYQASIKKPGKKKGKEVLPGFPPGGEDDENAKKKLKQLQQWADEYYRILQELADREARLTLNGLQMIEYESNKRIEEWKKQAKENPLIKAGLPGLKAREEKIKNLELEKLRQENERNIIAHEDGARRAYLESHDERIKLINLESNMRIDNFLKEAQERGYTSEQIMRYLKTEEVLREQLHNAEIARREELRRQERIDEADRRIQDITFQYEIGGMDKYELTKQSLKEYQALVEELENEMATRKDLTPEQFKALRDQLYEARTQFRQYTVEMLQYSDDMWGGMKKGALDYKATLTGLYGDMRTLTSQALGEMENMFTDLFDNVLTQKVTNWADFFKNVVDNLLRMLAQFMAKMTMATLTGQEKGGWSEFFGGLSKAVGFFGGLFGGGGGGGIPGTNAIGGAAGTTSSIYGDMLSAFFGVKGMAIRNSNVIPFATGGIIDRPTVFPIHHSSKVALGGELANEAILPLKRTPNGVLGVMNAGGNGGNITSNVEVHVHSDGTTSRIQSTEGMNPSIAAQLGKILDNKIIEAIVQQKRAGGLLA